MTRHMVYLCMERGFCVNRIGMVRTPDELGEAPDSEGDRRPAAIGTVATFCNGKVQVMYEDWEGGWYSPDELIRQFPEISPEGDAL